MIHRINKIMKTEKPSGIGIWILKKIIPENDFRYFLGDIEESYHGIQEKKGRIFTYFWFWLQIAKTIPPIIIDSFFRSMVMLKNYLKIAFRSITKNKVISLINVFGLAAGLACTILIFLFIKDELSYDKFHNEFDKIYRLTTSFNNPDGSIKSAAGTVAIPHGPAMKDFFNEINMCVRTWPITFIVNRNNFAEDEEILFADKDFFNMFTFPFISGNAASVLDQINSVVLSGSYAEKYFGDEDPIGKVISIYADESGESNDFIVSGIVEDPPQNSTLTPNIVVPYESLGNFGWDRFMENWGFMPRGSTFIRVNDNNSQETIMKNHSAFIDQYFSARFIEIRSRLFGDVKSDEDPLSFGMQKLTDIHLDPRVTGSPDLSKVYILSGIAIIILAIASINFIILSIGNASKRFLEIGIRKVVGAGKKQLVIQFISESILMTGFAVVLGIGIVYVIMPIFNELILKGLTFTDALSASSLWFFAFLILVIGAVVGCYPAFVMTKPEPVETFKGKYKFGGRNIFTQFLVTSQFVLSIILLLSAITLGRQINYLLESDYGYNRENIVYLDMRANNAEDADRLFKLFNDRLANNSEIVNISGTSHILPRTYVTDRIVYKGDTYEDIGVTFVDHNYLETLGININEGRDFSPDFSTDIEAVIVNETLVRDLEIADPVGKQIELSDEIFNIIGITDDFHLRELKYGISPAVFMMKPEPGAFRSLRMRYLVFKISPSNTTETLETISSTWKELQPGMPMNYSFLDENINSMFLQEKRWYNIVAYSSVLSILIACMGIFGLTSLTISKRKREISIRKVHGASIGRILALISRDSVRWVLIASFIALPIGYYVMQRWLQNFTYRISISPLIFMICTLAILILVLATISFQVLKAAQANPIDSLRNE
ncbi:MAG: FtsX-like permease family protein [bacterium]|nr:FtsX-like permease family protein [bacterium]